MKHSLAMDIAASFFAESFADSLTMKEGKEETTEMQKEMLRREQQISDAAMARSER